MGIKSIEKLSLFNNNKRIINKIEKGFLDIKNEAFYIPSDVNYNTKVMFLDRDNFKYTGYLSVLKRIVQSDYILHKIRTEGGAYGGDMSISDSGLVVLNSYSDPNILKTYNNFNKISDYLKDLNISEKELHMYKIGTINILDRPMKDYEINQVAMSRYFKGLDEKELYEQRQQVLNTNINDIKNYFKVIKDSLNTNNICTPGNKDDINLCKNRFLSVKKI